MPAQNSPEALTISLETQAAQQRHEVVCAERYLHINNSITEIKSVMKWFGSTLLGMVLLVLGWSLTQQYAANENQKVALEAKIEMLEREAQAH